MRHVPGALGTPRLHADPRPRDEAPLADGGGGGWAIRRVDGVGNAAWRRVHPAIVGGTIVVISNKPPSINLDASLKTVTEIERVIRGFPDVSTVVSQTGSAATPTDPMGVQSTDTYVILKPQGQWKTASTQQGIRDAIEKKVKAAIPGADFEFSQPIQMRMDDLLQGVRTPVSLTFYGEDLSTLTALADKAEALIKKIKGAGDVRPQRLGGLPALTIRIDRAHLARYGINAQDALAVVSAIGGYPVGMVAGELHRGGACVWRRPGERRTGRG